MRESLCACACVCVRVCVRESVCMGVLWGADERGWVEIFVCARERQRERK